MSQIQKEIEKTNINTPLTAAIISLSIVICVFYIVRTTALEPGKECGVDAYYHITMGDLFPELGYGKCFPWTRLSLWNKNFFNKELAFHLLIYSIRKWGGLMGIAQIPPFNFVSTCLLCVLLFFITFGALRLDISTAYLIPPLLVAVSPLFYLRINMIRPHMMGVLLFTAVLYVLFASISDRAKFIWIFFLGIVYVYGYSSPQLMFLPILAYSVSESVLNRKLLIKRHFFLLLCGLAGILCGLLFHPQFPNSFYAWYVQGILVWKQIIGYDLGVDLGLELLSPSFSTQYQNIGIYLLFIINIFLYWKLKNKGPNILTLLICQGIMMVGFFFSERCIEYTVPAGVLCFCFILHCKFKETCDPLPLGNKSLLKFRLISFTAILLVFLAFVPFNLKELRMVRYSACNSFGKWASKALVPGTYIGHIRWGEFPRLFYAAPQFRYSMALDPMFTYAVSPEKIRQLETFRLLKNPLEPEELRDILETDLVFISTYDPVPAKHLIAKKAEIIYHGKDGWLLKLPSKLSRKLIH